MFETREQYEAALGQLQTPEEQEQFIQQHGDGSNLPTEAEKAVTQLETPQEAAQPIIPVTADSPIPDFLPQEAEPATEEEINQYANYVKEEEDAIWQGEMDRIMEQRKLETALLDDEGNPMVDELTGEYLRRDLTNAELINNSVQNISNDIQSQVANINIGTGEVFRRLFGEEAIEEWVNNPEISDFWKVGLGEEGFEEELKDRELADAGRREVGSITDGQVLAGVVNGLTSVGSSALVNTLTLGGGLPIQFTGQFYTDFNKAKAEAEGKTIEELREDGEDNFWAPASFGMLAGLAEKFGLEGAGAAVAKRVSSKAAGALATRLFNGLGEGTTELIQTGLEAANEAMAKEEDATEAFVDGVFSKDGLEAFLQGAVGGGAVSGAGQNHRNNIKKARQVASALRAPVDHQAITELMAKESDLRATMQTTKDPEVRKQLSDEIKSVQSEMKSHVVKANGLVQRMTDKQIDQALSIKEAAQGFAAVNKGLIEKFQNGEINQKEYDSAREALKNKFDKKKEQLNKIADEAADQPIQREKDMVTPKRGKSTWSTITAPAIDNEAQQNIKDGKITEEGIWNILQSKEIGNVVRAAINKRFAAQGQEYDATQAAELESELLYGGKQSIHGLLKSWDASKGASPASYIYGQIQNKLTGKLAKLEDKANRGAARIDQIAQNEDSGRGIQLADDQEADAPVQDTKRRTTEQQAARLGVSPRTASEVKGKMETLLADGVLNPADKNFEKKYAERFRDQLVKPVLEDMGKKDNYINWVNQNAKNLLNIYSPRTLSKKRNDPAFAWIENPPTEQEFIDYHFPVKEDGTKDAGLESKRKKRLAEAISEGIGFRAMEDNLAEQQEKTTRGHINAGFDKVIDTLRKLQGDRDTLQSNPLAIAPAALEAAVLATKTAFNAGADMYTAMQEGYKKIADKVDFDQYKRWVEGQIKALKSPTSWAEMSQARVQQEIDLAANKVQEAVDPNSQLDLFEQSTEITDADEIAGSKAMEELLAKHGYGKPFSFKKSKEAVQEYRDFLKNEIASRFPREFFFGTHNNFTLGYAGDNKIDSAIKRGMAFTNESLNAWANDVKFYTPKAGDPDFSAFKKVAFNSKNVQKKFNDPATAKIQKNNMDVLEFFANQIQDIVQKNPNAVKYIPALLKGFTNNQKGLIRASAPVKGTSTNFDENLKGHAREVEEHTLPANLVGRYILYSALEGKVQDNFKNIRNNFFQIMLDRRDDNKLKGDGFNYTSAMPKGWKMSDNAWARYFNARVNANNGGIDPNSIYLFEEGKTVAELFNAKPIDAHLTPKLKKYFKTKRRIGAEFGLPAGKRVGAEFIHNPYLKAQQEVVSEKVGDQFEQFMDKAIGALEGVVKNDGVLQANIAAIPVHVLVGGLRAAKLAYRGARNLAQAIEAGYNVVKDYMSRQEWAEFTGKAIKEVKNTATGATVGLQWASENAIKLQQQADLNGKFNEIIEQKTGGKIKASEVFGKGDIGKPKRLGLIRSFFNHPSAEDLNGLLYSILPSGKQGEAAKKFFRENIITPYQRGVTQMNAYKANLHQGFRRASKLMSDRKLGKTIPGMNHTWNNAVRVALAVKNGQELKGINNETAEKLLSAVKANPKAAAYVDKINDLFDGSFKFNAKDMNRPIGGELAGRADKVKRAEFIKDYLANAEQVFSEENLNKIEAAAGKAVRDNLEKTLARMKSGKNRTMSQDSSTNKLLNWINNAQAMIMFTNMRSAALQTLSMFNYINTGGNNIFRAAGNLANVKQYRADMKMLWNSDYLRGRRGNLGFDIAADEIADAASSAEGLSKLLDKVRQLGFKPTQLMDSFAISRGGALYYRTRLNKYTKEGHPNPEQAAMDDFIYLTEESQQSADPSRISQIQAGPLGRIVFAFGNTPFQYARVMKRAVSDLAAGRGNPINNLARISYYTGIQAMLFNTLQQALWMGDDEEEKDERKQYALMGAIQSWFKSLGLGGAALSTGLAIAQETSKGHRADYLKAATSFSPPISAKLRQLGQAGRAIEKGDKLEASVKGAEAIFNVPTDRLMTKFNNLEQVIDGDLDGMQTLMKALGWSDYSLGIDKDTTGRSPRRVRRRERPRRERSRRSPVNKLGRGEMGQAFNDGTIEIDPKLKGKERELTIKHEKKHAQDMKDGILDYDDNNITYKGKKYARNNGKIQDADGSWKKEGDPSLPWEKTAYAAEKSPLKKDKPKPGTPEWDKHVQEGVQFNKDWYNEPGTRAMLEEQAPRYKGKVDKYINRMGDVHFDHAEHLEPGEVAEFYRNPYAEEGEHEFNVGIGPDHSVDRPGLVEHELTHAAGWDYDLGKKVLDVTGGPDKSTRFGRYLGSPDEAYANLQELRKVLGLRPDQRDLTPEQLQKLADEKGNDDVKAYIKAFGVDNVAKAHNQVADAKPKIKKRPSLDDLYNNQDNKYYT